MLLLLLLLWSPEVADAAGGVGDVGCCLAEVVEADPAAVVEEAALVAAAGLAMGAEDAAVTDVWTRCGHTASGDPRCADRDNCRKDSATGAAAG